MRHLFSLFPGPRGWLVLFLLAMGAASCLARPGGDWTDSPTREWYAGLMQPDNPTASCCGEADAYWCDGIRVRDGRTYCVITDDRVVAGRTPVPVGTEIEIPDRKLKWDAGNPTGHAIVFLSSGGAVFCFVQNGGV